MSEIVIGLCAIAAILAWIEKQRDSHRIAKLKDEIIHVKESQLAELTNIKEAQLSQKDETIRAKDAQIDHLNQLTSARFYEHYISTKTFYEDVINDLTTRGEKQLSLKNTEIEDLKKAGKDRTAQLEQIEKERDELKANLDHLRAGAARASSREYLTQQELIVENSVNESLRPARAEVDSIESAYKSFQPPPGMIESIANVYKSFQPSREVLEAIGNTYRSLQMSPGEFETMKNMRESLMHSFGGELAAISSLYTSFLPPIEAALAALSRGRSLVPIRNDEGDDGEKK